MLSYSELADQVLFDLIKSDDKAAFKLVYDRYFDVLYIHAYKRLKDKEEAKDIVQEIFVILWDKRQQITLRINLLAYLYTAVRNKIFNVIAHNHVETTH